MIGAATTMVLMIIGSILSRREERNEQKISDHLPFVFYAMKAKLMEQPKGTYVCLEF